MKIDVELEVVKKTHPALYVLMSDQPDFRLTAGCGGCPYGQEAPETDPSVCEGCARHEASGDDDKWFICKLLDQQVWGEEAPCTEKLWRKKAREEFITLIGKRLPT